MFDGPVVCLRILDRGTLVVDRYRKLLFFSYFAKHTIIIYLVETGIVYFTYKPRFYRLKPGFHFKFRINI